MDQIIVPQSVYKQVCEQRPELKDVFAPNKPLHINGGVNQDIPQNPQARKKFFKDWAKRYTF